MDDYSSFYDYFINDFDYVWFFQYLFVFFCCLFYECIYIKRSIMALIQKCIICVNRLNILIILLLLFLVPIVCKYVFYLFSFLLWQMKTTFSQQDFWDFRFTYQTRPVRRTGCCVLGTLSIPGQQYLIKWTSRVSHMEDMSFITTTELAFYIHQSIVSMHTRNYVKLKYTVNWK